MTEYFHDTLDSYWSLSEALNVVKRVEEVVSPLKAHVALTGGLLYKEGLRKDLDLMFYRVRQEPHLAESVIIDALRGLGFDIKTQHGWVYKALYERKNVDLFFPENYPYAKELGKNGNYGETK